MRMIFTVEKKKMELAIENGFIAKQLTKNIYIGRMYGNKELHPIGYHIPVLVITKSS